MPAGRKPCPWIEELVLGYGTERGSRGSERLRARVTRVEPMSQSQAQSSDCPTGLLLLSDGSVLIPAVLTTAAWERLQEQEDRDSLDGLVNSSVVIVDYQLQFHMAQEQNKCRFFLSVGELAMTSAGPPGNRVPCCTALASVRAKVCQAWTELLDEKLQDSPSSQSGLDLSVLLGEWHRDCIQDVLRDVEQRLASTPTPTPTPPATGWDVDRVRFKAEKSFSVPVKCLLIPEHVLGPDRPPGPGAGPRLLPPAERSVGPLSNPWDIFPPPGDSPCSSGASPGETPPGPGHSPPPAFPPGTQLQPEPSGLPPYQAPPPRDPHAPAGGASQACTGAAPSTQQLPVSEETGDRKLRRKRRQSGEGPGEGEEGPGEGPGEGDSPPSWLFHTQTRGGAQQEQRHHRSVLRKAPSAHSDGSSFSYSYRVSGQNQQDLGRFQVQAAWLQWALGYLLRPEKNPGPVSDQGS